MYPPVSPPPFCPRLQSFANQTCHHKVSEFRPVRQLARGRMREQELELQRVSFRGQQGAKHRVELCVALSDAFGHATCSVAEASGARAADEGRGSPLSAPPFLEPASLLGSPSLYRPPKGALKSLLGYSTPPALTSRRLRPPSVLSFLSLQVRLKSLKTMRTPCRYRVGAGAPQ